MRGSASALLRLCLCGALVAPACSDAGGPAASPGSAGDAGVDALADVGADAEASAPLDGAPDAGGAGLGFLSLNLHCFVNAGSAYADDAQRFEAIAQGIAGLGVQVVALQEACVTTSRHAALDLAARLGQLTGKTWHSSWFFAHLAWQGTADEAEEGVALLADRPLDDVRPVTYLHQQGLARVALSARVALGAGDVRVMSVHLDHQNAAARLQQARESGVAALADAYPSAAVIVAGDFNAQEGSSPHQALGEQGFVDASEPLADERIDHVFVHRGAPLEASEVGLVFQGPEAVSDHPGVLVRFAARTPLGVALTRVRATAALPSGGFLSIRGSAAPLSWDAGWTLRAQPNGSWEYVSSELSGSFEYKLLRDDVAWQTGENQSGTAGADHQSAPSF